MLCNAIIYSIRFSEDEQEIIEQHALHHAMKISDVIRNATTKMIEDEMDICAFIEAKERLDKNSVTHTHEDVGKELRFL